MDASESELGTGNFRTLSQRPSSFHTRPLALGPFTSVPCPVLPAYHNLKGNLKCQVGQKRTQTDVKWPTGGWGRGLPSGCFLTCRSALG